MAAEVATLKGAAITAATAGLVRCERCGLLGSSAGENGQVRCIRCSHALQSRKTQSLPRTMALLITAAICYIPANLLPIMHTTTLAYDEDDTILSGVVALWSGGSWPLALLVFTVSIVVPLLKLISLTLLVWSVHRQWSGHLLERARLYRLIEIVGRWSMMDVFVVALLGALVQLRGLAVIHGRMGILAFGAVVVLTMCASKSFDPRLMWDRAFP